MRQKEAYEKWLRGQKLSELDIHDLANRPELDSAKAQKDRAQTSFWFGLICLALPGGSFLYLAYQTAKKG